MLEVKAERREIRPLDRVSIHGAEGGTVSVRDAMGREYYRAPAAGEVAFRVSGALGHHVVFIEDDEGRLVASTGFRVDCRTEVEDEGGRFHDLLDMLYYTMTRWGERDSIVKLAGKFYRYYVRWLRDHVHTLKGMKYFDGDIKTGIELYADHQQPNGMIWDRIAPATRETTWRDHTFSYGGFIAPAAGGTRRFERIPVENDVEYLFIEGLYYTWKATGDDDWMAGLVDNAIRAVEYGTTDPYRWSEKYGLLKRGFTIDTWDFQSKEDAEIAGGQAMVIDRDRTRFGVMHGDNTGMMAALRYLAEMLEVASRAGEAPKYRELADTIKERLDGIAWNGSFYTHHVPEDPGVVRDLGVDQSRQVSLSNAYDLNRGITHEQCAAIVKTYQRIREEMPATSAGEFYQIYPPFERGFGGHNAKWQYMNGGVTTIVAGELAHGAFEHGFEEYGADILDRVRGWGEKHEGYLHCCLRGAMPEAPERSFEPVDVSARANVDFCGEGAAGVPGWTGEGENDLSRMPTGRQVFDDIPFNVIDPAENGRRACLGISSVEGYSREITVPVGRRAASVYFLHTLAGDGLVGWIALRYADGGVHIQYIHSGREIGPWYMPQDPRSGGKRDPVCKVAWHGGNATFPNVGCYVFGMNNPHPEKEVEEIALTAAETGGKWFVLGVTLSDAPVYFPPSDVSFGIPDNWGAGAVVYALLEGLAGIKDTGRAFDGALVAPRWRAAGVKSATVTAKYEASGGYVRYRYSLDEAAGRLTLDVASSAEAILIEVLLPPGREAGGVKLDGEAADFETKKIESSRYVCLDLAGVGAHAVEVTLGRRPVDRIP